MKRFASTVCLSLLVTLPIAAADRTDDRWLGISDFGEWSPDGSHIAFHSTRDGNFEIYVMKSDGTEQRRLTHNPWADAFPAFSPDGQTLVFSARRDGWITTPSRNQLYLIDVDGENLQQLTLDSHLEEDPGRPSSNNVYPRFHPEGWVAFLSDRSNGWLEVFRIDPDGRGLKRLTHGRRNHYNLVVSPGGERLCFDTHKDRHPTAAIRDGGWDIHCVASEGGPYLNLTANPRYEDYDSTMSPDGQRIIYNRSGHRGLFMMNGDGSGQTDEAFYEESAFSPRWSPDGRRLLFTSTRDGHRELYVMELETRAVERLTYSRP